VNDLVNGRISLTDEMATRLSDVFGTSVTLWRNLNKSYNEKKAEIEQRMQTDEKFKLQSSWNNRRKVPVG
jgi:plasmid maintenance system antidote protein VapI